MKSKLKVLAVASVIFFTLTAQAQSVKGPEREIAFTVQPQGNKNGYEVKITLKYRFQLCVDKITLDGYRTKHEPQAYWYNGKRYTYLDLDELNRKNNTALKFAPADQHLCPNLDFTADIYAYREQAKGGGLNVGEPQLYAKGEWFWVNLSSWGSCLGDYGGKYKGYENEMSAARKNRIGDLFLKNIKPKDSPSRDYEIENALGGKTQRPLETFKDVKQVTENLKSEAKSAAAERANAQKQSKNGKSQSVDDLLNSTGRAEKQQDLDALLGSTGYSKQEQTNRNLTQADATAANITSFSDRTHLAEAQKLYQKALADEPNNSHAANQLKRVEWILKNYGVEINGVTWAISNVGKPGEFVENDSEVVYYHRETAQMACPEGWRLPTKSDFEKLVASGSREKKTEKISGREFANGKLFLPLVGYGNNRHNQENGFYNTTKGDYFYAPPTNNINGVYWGSDCKFVIFGFSAIGSVATADKPYRIDIGQGTLSEDNRGWECVRCVLDSK